MFSAEFYVVSAETDGMESVAVEDATKWDNMSLIDLFMQYYNDVMPGMYFVSLVIKEDGKVLGDMPQVYNLYYDGSTIKSGMERFMDMISATVKDYKEVLHK